MNFKKTYVAKLESLDEIYVDVEIFCKEAHVDDKTKYALNLCLDEIFTNIVSYGYKGDKSKNVEIELKREAKEISAVVRDDAPAFNPLEDATTPDISSDAESREVGGLGVFFIKKNMDKLSYKRENGKNQLTMARNIAE